MSFAPDHLESATEGVGFSGVEVVRSAEHAHVSTVRVPVQQLRLRKRIVTEERTMTVTVRREELVVERVPAAPGSTVQEWPETGPVLELVLHEEIPEIVTRVVPRERVRIHVETDTQVRQIPVELLNEQIEVVQTPTKPN